MSEPTQTCALCGRVEEVVQNGPGFPPDQAAKRLRRKCGAEGCPSDPQYRAGVDPALAWMFREDAS